LRWWAVQIHCLLLLIFYIRDIIFYKVKIARNLPDIKSCNCKYWSQLAWFVLLMKLKIDVAFKTIKIVEDNVGHWSNFKTRRPSLSEASKLAALVLRGLRIL